MKRRERDLNPWYPFWGYTRLAIERLRPDSAISPIGKFLYSNKNSMSRIFKKK